MKHSLTRKPGARSFAFPVNKQSGVGLIEIMVAVLVLGIGILGIASTQIISLQMNTQSQNRSQAVLLAEDLLDRIRAAWENNLACLLPAAERTVAVNGDTVTVTIDWDQDDAAMNPVVVRTQI